jgi:hypothetical protein
VRLAISLVKKQTSANVGRGVVWRVAACSGYEPNAAPLFLTFSVLKEHRFRILDILFDHPSYSNFFINIIYFVMTYFIIRDTLIMIYLFYNLHKIFK